MGLITKHIIFIGRVQGVGFRFTASNIANRNQLTGQVRNLPDGSVEMIAQGLPDDIDDCLDEIKRAYPGGIKEVKIQETHPPTQYKDFKITF